MRRPWFLRSEPDVLELLRVQVRITRSSLQAFAEWSTGADGGAAARVRANEHEGDTARRELVEALREVLSAPLDQEDLYIVSDRLDLVQNTAKNVVRQAEGAGWHPDDHAARMAGSALAGIEHLVEAFDALPDDLAAASSRADAAVKTIRGLEKEYRAAITDLAGSTDPAGAVVMAAEIYRRYDLLGAAVMGVSHRVWFSVLKEA